MEGKEREEGDPHSHGLEEKDPLILGLIGLEEGGGGKSCLAGGLGAIVDARGEGCFGEGGTGLPLLL